MRKALELRKLYSNWLFTLIEYKVLGRPAIAVRCRGGATNIISRELYLQLIDFLESEVLAGCVGGNLKLNIGGKTQLVPLEEVKQSQGWLHLITRALEHGWTYNIQGRYWERGGVKFIHMHQIIFVTFENEEYGVVDVRGRQVVDVGAFIGDSAIYFSLKGAERVYAIEPHPLAYEELVQNVSLNGLQGKVVPLNLGISYTENYIIIPPNLGVEEAAGTLLTSMGSKGLRVKAKKLSEIVDEYKVKPDVLKIDCEGCEYDIILKDYDTVSQFEQVVFEYHAYNVGIPISKLIELLSRQFSCSLINEHLYERIIPNWDKEEIGDYYCIKRR